jgi:hypothetical protein
MEEQAKQERAVNQYNAQLMALKDRTELGQTKHSLAGSGFTLDDPTSQTIIGQTVEQQTLSELLMVRQGEQRARGVEQQARINLFEGRMAASAKRSESAVGLLKNGSSWWNNYGSGFVNHGAG